MAARWPRPSRASSSKPRTASVYCLRGDAVPMSLSDLLERLGRNIFESPFGVDANPSESPEVAEIRFAILDQVKRKMQRTGGKLVFPYNFVRIHVRGVQES